MSFSILARILHYLSLTICIFLYPKYLSCINSSPLLLAQGLLYDRWLKQVTFNFREFSKYPYRRSFHIRKTISSNLKERLSDPKQLFSEDNNFIIYSWVWLDCPPIPEFWYLYRSDKPSVSVKIPILAWEVSFWLDNLTMTHISCRMMIWIFRKIKLIYRWLHR